MNVFLFSWPARLLLASLATIGVAVQAHAQSSLDNIRSTRNFVIAFREGQMPFSGKTADAVIGGYSVDLCLKIAQAVKRELKLPVLNISYLPVNSLSRFTTIAEGKADIECGSTSNNAERRTRFNFTIPHFFTAVRMLVPANSGIRNWPDLHDKRVGALKGGTIVGLIKNRSDVRALNISTIELASLNDAVRMLQNNELAAIVSSDVFLYSQRTTMKKPADYLIVGTPLSLEQYGLMMQGRDLKLKEIADKELIRLFRSGEINAIYNRWFMHAIPPDGPALDMPMSQILREMIRYPTRENIR